MDKLDGKFKEVLEFRSTLDNESDRGCALMAAAYLDDNLKALIQSGLVDDTHVAGKIIGTSGPLGTFSSRIDMCYLLGYVSSEAHRDLHLIRKIRNEFGHNSKQISFNSDSIKNRCFEIYHKFRPNTDPPRSLFTNSVCGVLAMIHGAVLDQSRPKPVPRMEITDGAKKRVAARSEELFELLSK